MACPNGRETAPEGREALISDLEEFGYDTMPGVQRDWRESLSDDQLRRAITGINHQIAMRAFGIGQTEGDTSELPDIGEMTEAIREAIAAADAFNAAHPDFPDLPEGEAAARFKAAFDRLRALNACIDKSLESF